MNDDAPKKDEYTQYLKRPVLEETNTPNPIQGPIRNPDKLYHFIKDVHDATAPKMWAVYLGENDFSLGNEPLALGPHAEPEHFDIESIFHYYYLFMAKSVILLTNHINGDATPTDADRKLIERIHTAIAPLRRVSLRDYVIVGDGHYWSMTVQDGTACHCGQQHHWRKE